MTGLCLIGPVWIGKKRAAQADEILNALLQLLLRLFRRADQVGRQYGNRYIFLHGFCEIAAPAGLEAGRLQPIIHGLVGGTGNVDCVDAAFL